MPWHMTRREKLGDFKNIDNVQYISAQLAVAYADGGNPHEFHRKVERMHIQRTSACSDRLSLVLRTRRVEAIIQDAEGIYFDRSVETLQKAKGDALRLHDRLVPFNV